MLGVNPVAHTSSEATAATAKRWLPEVCLVLALGTMLHAMPSQCNVSVCGAVNDVGCCVPTAHTSSEAIAVTAASPLSTSGPTFGLGTWLQAAPFQ